MADVLLPLFPLRMVALPQSRIPLHIFEDRYREMVQAVLGAGGEFGIVLAEGQGIVNIGCTVTVEEVLKRYGDGRMDILCRGRRRFEIVLLNEEESYLRASVQFFGDDQEEASAVLRAQAIETWRQVRALLSEDLAVELDLNSAPLSFELAQAVGDLNVRQVLLQMRSEEERLEQLIGYFGDYEARQQRIFHVRRVAPTNGHGPSLGDLDEAAGGGPAGEGPAGEGPAGEGPQGGS